MRDEVRQRVVTLTKTTYKAHRCALNEVNEVREKRVGRGQNFNHKLASGLVLEISNYNFFNLGYSTNHGFEDP